jgi:signal transduction histidine kinase
MAWSTDGMLDSVWAATRRQLAMLVGIAALILSVVALFADRIIIRPVVAIAGAMDRLSAAPDAGDGAPGLTDYSARKDEIGSLGRALEQLQGSDREVRQLNERLHAAIANMGAGLCMFDRDQRLIISNHQYAALYRLDPAAVVPGMSLRDILELRIVADQFPAQTAEEFMIESERRCTEGRPSVWKICLPDDRIIDMQFRPLPTGGWLSIHEDVTERERAAEELRRRRDYLQELVDEATAELLTRAEDLKRALSAEQKLNQIQRQFVSMASHEFRTPLTIIDAAAQGLKRRFERLTAEQAGERIDRIRGAVKRMTRLVESTLMAARAEEGKLHVEIEDCDIAGIVREVCERHQEVAGKHRIACELVGLPSTIRADASALDQILTNLVSNAVKYAPDSPEVRVIARGDGDEVTISVTDRGVGIDEDDLQHIFERFFRAKTSTGIAGTGIGLNLTKMLAEMHGGSISLESRAGEGSTFTVRLPVDGPRQTAQPQCEAA